jgi:hypothetical protein
MRVLDRRAVQGPGLALVVSILGSAVACGGSARSRDTVVVPRVELESEPTTSAAARGPTYDSIDAVLRAEARLGRRGRSPAGSPPYWAAQSWDVGGAWEVMFNLHEGTAIVLWDFTCVRLDADPIACGVATTHGVSVEVSSADQAAPDHAERLARALTASTPEVPALAGALRAAGWAIDEVPDDDEHTFCHRTLLLHATRDDVTATAHVIDFAPAARGCAGAHLRILGDRVLLAIPSDPQDAPRAAALVDKILAAAR